MCNTCTSNLFEKKNGRFMKINAHSATVSYLFSTCGHHMEFGSKVITQSIISIFKIQAVPWSLEIIFIQIAQRTRICCVFYLQFGDKKLSGCYWTLQTLYFIQKKRLVWIHTWIGVKKTIWYLCFFSASFTRLTFPCFWQSQQWGD